LIEVLYETAAESLSNKFNNKLNNVVEFYTEMDDSATSASVSCKSLVKIMKRVKKVRKSSPVCDNCESSPCIKGKALTRDNFVPGSKVYSTSGSQSTFKLRKLHEKSDLLLATRLPLPLVDGPSKMSSYYFKRSCGDGEDIFVYDC